MLQQGSVRQFTIRGKLESTTGPKAHSSNKRSLYPAVGQGLSGVTNLLPSLAAALCRRVWHPAMWILKRRREAENTRETAETYQTMASPAVQLASSCALPAAVSHSHDVHSVQATGDPVLRSERLKQGNSNVQIAPYQALPVAGPIITHIKATALDVQELSPDMSEEVGRAVPYCRCWWSW